MKPKRREVALAVTNEYTSNPLNKTQSPPVAASANSTAGAGSAVMDNTAPSAPSVSTAAPSGDISASSMFAQTSPAIAALTPLPPPPPPPQPCVFAASALIPPPARPPVPQQCSVAVAHLMSACWASAPSMRPTATQVLHELPNCFP